MNRENKQLNMKLLFNSLFIFLLSSQIIFAQKVITKKHFGTNITKEEYQVDAQGQRNGFYKSYNPDGVFLYSYNYKNGNEHGICIDYAGQRDGRDIYCYGKPLSERVMDNGKIVSEKYYGCANNSNYLVYSKKLIAPKIYENITYHKNGKINEKFNENSYFEKEKGMYEKYYDNGKLAERGMIDNGKFGNWVGFFENGDTMYVTKNTAGFETYYKKFYPANKVEFIQTMDDNFENISKTEYFQNGKIKSEKISKTFPFKYECGSSSDPKNPKNWRELAEQRILCAGQSFSPFDNSYIVSEKKYAENGELISETLNVLRKVDGKNKVLNKKDIEAEDILWQNIEKDNSYENLGKYYNQSTINFYSSEVNKIFYALNDKYQKEIDKNYKTCEDLEYDSKSKSSRADGNKSIAETKKSGKIYPKFEAANSKLEEQIKADYNKLAELEPKFKTMKDQISEGGDIDLSKINKKELSILINNRLEIEKSLNNLTDLRAKLWGKYITSLNDKNFKKALTKVTTTEELLELVKS
jgi:antitoxin component YwqK of YwqJK toxin-antitoxin module